MLKGKLQLFLSLMRRIKGARITKERVIENYKRYQARVKRFQELGYDIPKERDFIIEKSQPVEGALLELGTGKGYFTLALAQKGYCLTTVDISQEEQQFARMNIEYFGLAHQVNFVVGNAEQLGFADESFDMAFAINVIHHLNQPFKVIDELMRIMTQQGKIILSDFSKRGFEIVSQMHGSEGRYHSSGKYSLKDIEKYLLNKNCQLEKYHTDFQDLMIVYKGRH